MLRFHPHFSSLLAGSALLLTAVTAVRADIVSDWNALALESMTTTADPLVAHDLAILAASMYNADQSIEGTYNTYDYGAYPAPGSGPVGADSQAAMIAAANTVMQYLYSGSSSEASALYSSQLSGIADSQAKTDGIGWGITIANNLLSARSADGSADAATTTYSPVGTIGYWQQTSAAGALLPGWGSVGTFSIPGTGSYMTSLPGGSVTSYLQSSQYAADYAQVKDLGAAFSATRTSDQTNQAYFWAAGDGTVKMTGMWNQIATTVATNAGLSTADVAHLLATLNVAMADASTAAMATIYDTQFWRPETAIANGDIDGNASTDVDSFWAPLITSPSLPEYVSLGATISEAAAVVLASYLGDSVSFSLGSDINGDGSIDLTRNFTSFSQAANEAAMAGVYGGTQFQTSVADGQIIGYNVANYVLGTNFALVPEPAGAVLMMLGGLFFLGARRRR
ncbi:MAG: PEP-CTERM sorting domain-containing protein [Prosthecobacter sp.]|uniref:PEP-CTERM sorting domain-containing protein n=1 Tax=Prosthecobacter sp. TaxID=1965333 RepID=UPI00261B0E4D|nr:PEP-CTERM sorting domain-containing protein [Prosthecobacter sp.]MCF7788749.1 PEP-CTERM sorting domain-containing protein [Prosthecobacter sp.]